MAQAIHRCITRRPSRMARGSRLRRGVSTLWMLLFVPAFVTLFCVLVEISNLWLARVELENALEAAALAGVKSWGEGSSTATARNVAMAYANANQAGGAAVPLENVEGALPNNNSSCTGNIVLGAVTGAAPNYTLDADTVPGAGTEFGIRVQRVVNVNSLCASVFGATVGPFQVSAQVEAKFNGSSASPELIRVTTFHCSP